jgi:hypothetical protein
MKLTKNTTHEELKIGILNAIRSAEYAGSSNILSKISGLTKVELMPFIEVLIEEGDIKVLNKYSRGRGYVAYYVPDKFAVYQSLSFKDFSRSGVEGRQ